MGSRESFEHFACWTFVIVAYMLAFTGPVDAIKIYARVLAICAFLATLIAAFRLFPLIEVIEPGEPSAKEFWGIYGSAWGAASAILFLIAP